MTILQPQTANCVRGVCAVFFFIAGGERGGILLVISFRVSYQPFARGPVRHGTRFCFAASALPVLSGR